MLVNHRILSEWGGIQTKERQQISLNCKIMKLFCLGRPATPQQPAQNATQKINDFEKSLDVYESISDEEFDAFDDNEEEVKLPQPASVMEVDWSLLSSLNKTEKPAGAVNFSIQTMQPKIFSKLTKTVRQLLRLTESQQEIRKT